MAGKSNWTQKQLEILSTYDRTTPSLSATELLQKHPKFGKSFHSIRIRLQREIAPLEGAHSGAVTRNENSNALTIDLTSDRVLTLEHLLAKAKVDLNVWRVEDWNANKWENVTKDIVTGKPTITEMYQVKARLKRLYDERIVSRFMDSLIARMNAHSPRYSAIPRSKQREAHLLEVSPFDLHMGKRAVTSETSDSPYDMKIAKTLLADAIDDLLSKASGFNIEKILFVVGNDLLHTDSSAQTTTKGTPQDTAAQHTEMFCAAIDAMVSAIDILRLAAPVQVVVVPGNHDRDSAFKLGKVLSAWYRNDKEVSVDDGATLRKYVQYGTTAIGFTHGSEEKHRDLPLIMATEQPEIWNNTTFRCFHVGHLHKQKETQFNAGDTYNGVTVSVLPSLCTADAWHTQMGYAKSRRAAQAFIYHKHDGEVARLTSNVKIQ
jgi:hypothetical protein